MRRFVSARSLPVVCVLAALAGAPASAQSIFGVNFLGENQFAGSARYRALGLSLYAALDSVSAVSANPAATADLSRLTFSVVEIAALSNVRSGDATAYENRFQFPSVMLGVPIRPGLVFSLGYRTRFEGKGDFSFERPIEGAPTALEAYRHRSGLFAVPVTIAWRAMPWARVAGVVQLERGAIRDESRVHFYATNYNDVESKRVRNFSATSWAVSAIVQVHPRLSLGAGWNTETAYNVDETFTYTRAEFDSASTWDLTLPASWEVGASVGITGRWWLSSHLYQRGAPEPRGFPQLAGSIGDERLLSFGIERRREESGSFFTRIPLRVGFFEDRWHLEYPEGRPVKSRFVTFGTGFGLPGGPGAVDVSFEIGQIGSVGANGLSERVFRFALGLSASEAWSKRKTER
jgi:hypothetical protein